jgi:hypothetical protein
MWGANGLYDFKVPDAISHTFFRSFENFSSKPLDSSTFKAHTLNLRKRLSSWLNTMRNHNHERVGASFSNGKLCHEAFVVSLATLHIRIISLFLSCAYVHNEALNIAHTMIQLCCGSKGAPKGCVIPISMQREALFFFSQLSRNPSNTLFNLSLRTGIKVYEADVFAKKTLKIIDSSASCKAVLKMKSIDMTKIVKRGLCFENEDHIKIIKNPWCTALPSLPFPFTQTQMYGPTHLLLYLDKM